MSAPSHALHSVGPEGSEATFAVLALVFVLFALKRRSSFFRQGHVTLKSRR